MTVGTEGSESSFLGLELLFLVFLELLFLSFLGVLFLKMVSCFIFEPDNSKSQKRRKERGFDHDFWEGICLPTFVCDQTYLIKNRMQRTNPTRINMGATDRPIVVVLSEEKNFHDKNTFPKKGELNGISMISPIVSHSSPISDFDNFFLFSAGSVM